MAITTEAAASVQSLASSLEWVLSLADRSGLSSSGSGADGPATLCCWAIGPAPFVMGWVGVETTPGAGRPEPDRPMWDTSTSGVWKARSPFLKNGANAWTTSFACWKRRSGSLAIILATSAASSTGTSGRFRFSGIASIEWCAWRMSSWSGSRTRPGRTCWAWRSSALMKLPADRRAELYAEGLKRIAGSGENDYRRFLLAECLEAYAELDEGQEERLRALLQAEAYREVEPLMKTTYEGGIEEGIERGIEQGERRLILRLMEARFGPLTPEVKKRVESLSPEALARLPFDLLKVQALEELHLED